MNPARGVPHALTIDVEEWFQVLNLRSHCPIEEWDGLPLRCAVPTRRILDLLDEFGAGATFFVLGWIAERFPELVREIAARGHEVGSHGYDHRLLEELGEEGFAEDLARTEACLEPLAGRPRSFRACTWSIGPRTPWALPLLVARGYERDSSIHPISHPDYGDPGAPVEPHWISTGAGRIFEIPPLVVSVLGRRLPLGGGGYLRLFPVGWIDRALRARSRAGRPACLYLHPWELDPRQPRVGVRGFKAFRHYVGLGRTEEKLRRLLARHRFESLERVQAWWINERPSG